MRVTLSGTDALNVASVLAERAGRHAASAQRYATTKPLPTQEEQYARLARYYAAEAVHLANLATRFTVRDWRTLGEAPGDALRKGREDIAGSVLFGFRYAD